MYGGCLLFPLYPLLIINDYGHKNFPDQPPFGAGDGFVNSLSICLESTKVAKLQTLTFTLDVARDLEHKTREQRESGLWHSLRQKRITARKCGIVAKRVSNFVTLVQKQQPSRYVQIAAMKPGIEMEGMEAFIYASKEKKSMASLYLCGLVINPKCPWLGSSLDRRVFDIEAAQNGSSNLGLFESKVV